MKIEMFVCFPDNTWTDQQYVDIPDNTPEEKIHDVACKILLAELEKSKTIVTHVGVAHIMQEE